MCCRGGLQEEVGVWWVVWVFLMLDFDDVWEGYNDVLWRNEWGHFVGNKWIIVWVGEAVVVKVIYEDDLSRVGPSFFGIV